MPRKDELKCGKELFEAIKGNRVADEQLAARIRKITIEVAGPQVKEIANKFDAKLKRGRSLRGIYPALINAVVRRVVEGIKKGEINPEGSSVRLAIEVQLNFEVMLLRTENERARNVSAGTVSVSELMKPRGNCDFGLFFSSELSEDQVKSALEAVTDFYRACGGIGFVVKVDSEEKIKRNPSGV